MTLLSTEALGHSHSQPETYMAWQPQVKNTWNGECIGPSPHPHLLSMFHKTHFHLLPLVTVACKVFFLPGSGLGFWGPQMQVTPVLWHTLGSLAEMVWYPISTPLLVE